MKRRNKLAIILSTGLALLSSSRSRADSDSTVDLSFVTGFALGNVTKLKSDGQSQTFQIGGIPLGLIWNRDVSQNWSTGLGGEILLDIVNKQMIRQGLTGTVAYHLLGGARRLDNPGEAIHMTTTNSFNLSLIVRAGLLNYAASDPKAPSINLSGGMWEIAAGFEYRKDLSDRSAAGIIGLLTITTLPASVERLSSRTYEVLFFWRSFL